MYSDMYFFASFIEFGKEIYFFISLMYVKNIMSYRYCSGPTKLS